MSLKAELETWAAALKAYDAEEFEKALELFSQIADSSKILTNMGLIYATLGEHETAVKHFIEATQLDQYLAVAYFQCGVSNFLLQRFDLAHKDFEEALLYLRGNQTINYEQLGLKFRLFSAEVLFNKGLAQIYMGAVEEGLADMRDASREKATEEHNVIDEAIRDNGDGYTVFSIPVGVLYRPSEKKLKNSVQKDYMGKAKLIASSDPSDNTTNFSGVERLKQGITPTGVYIERPDVNENPSANVTRSATVPSFSQRDRTDNPRLAGLERSKTTINVPPNARQLTSGLSSSPSIRSPPGSLARSNTQISAARPSANATVGGPMRGLSVRRPGAAGSPIRETRQTRGDDNGGLTDILDDYIGGYEGESGPAPPRMNAPPSDRVAAWARNNGGGYPPSRMGSRSAPGSQYAPSSVTGSLRRKTTRRTVRPRIYSTYEEEEEGYVSGEYDEALDMSVIRVKLHYQDDTRGIVLTPDVPFEEFMEKITSKFNKSLTGLGMKFKDEDGGKVTLRDESDYELAIETARENAKGKSEGKLEIWCTDL